MGLCWAGGAGGMIADGGVCCCFAMDGDANSVCQRATTAVTKAIVEDIAAKMAFLDWEISFFRLSS